ncbi:6-bisphosphatase class,Fructose-1 [Trichinella spiralis]|uniref:6-bisphosphatase class,Fructose-1 n=1 Tax=Trichinella spiralis TaxID=6334 RepID=A0ABR3KV07_TRISP
MYESIASNLNGPSEAETTSDDEHNCNDTGKDDNESNDQVDEASELRNGRLQININAFPVFAIFESSGSSTANKRVPVE